MKKIQKAISASNPDDVNRYLDQGWFVAFIGSDAVCGTSATPGDKFYGGFLIILEKQIEDEKRTH